MCDLCSFFRKDAPFRFHRPDKNTEIVLVGKKAKQYRSFFEKDIYPFALNHSIMTAVVGQPGSGKTQLLNHLENFQKKKNIACVLNLKDTKINYDYLVRTLSGSPSFQEFLNSNGFTLKNEMSAPEKVSEIGKLVRKVRAETGNDRFGICLFVDTVDEYIRKIESKAENKNEELRTEIIRDLIKATGTLLEDLPYTCVIFAITEDVNTEFEKVLKNNKPSESRFFFSTDINTEIKENEDYKLERFDEFETEEMVSAFLDAWFKRNGKSSPKFQETSTSAGLNLFPFTRDAINIFWNAGAIPGDTSLACLLALDRKLNFSNNNSDHSHLIVTETDAAWVVKQFSTYFNYEENIKIKIDSLLKGEAMEYEIKKITERAKSEYFDIQGTIAEASKNYLEALGESFSIKTGNIYKFTKNKYGLDEDFGTIDLVVDYNDIKVGLQFIVKETGKKFKGRLILDKTEALLSALRNSQIKRGLIILITDIECEKIQVYDSLKKRYENEQRFVNIRNEMQESIRTNYFPLISVNRISEKDAWCLLGLHTFIYGSTLIKRRQSGEAGSSEKDHEITLMENYSRYVERKLGFASFFEETLKRSPKVIRSPIKSVTAAILDGLH